VTKDLRSSLMMPSSAESSWLVYLQEAGHGLQTTNGPEVNSILEWAHRYEGACEETFPVLQQPFPGRCFKHGSG